jgi:hypothetical protein
MRLQEELGHYTGESSHVKALEAKNTSLKAKLGQALEQVAKGTKDHHQAREEWLASCED